MATDQSRRDIFICHASEDKPGVARPLADALRGEGLSVWFDEYELRIGDSLRRAIDDGIANARFGVVILSPSFFAKGWTNWELDGLVHRQLTGTDAVILPIWHEVGAREVGAYSPSLANVRALPSTLGTPALAQRIAEVVRDPKPP
jgi:TIR domain